MPEGSSSLPQYPDSTELRKPQSQEAPERRGPAVLLLVFINLVAGYAPSPFWLATLPGDGASALILLFSPISWVFIQGVNSLWIASLLLFGFFVVVFCSSVASCQSRTARFAVPGCIFAYSLAQGMLFAAFVRGIDALGRS